ncbi:MAG: alkane 1-monooxygenase [Rhodobacteraceae bacterium]|nr:alkane 1-monooxygenase [Paracoccaceae bacterium]
MANGQPLRADALRQSVRVLWQDWRPLRPFALATLGPVPILILGAYLGGIFALLAFLTMTALVYALDHVLNLPSPPPAQEADLARAEKLTVALGLTHFVLLIIAVHALSGGGGLGLLGWLATFIAFGLWFGQVSNSVAHELIHRTDKRQFNLGMAVFTSLLFGHHTSAHRLIHHRFVASTDDPNTAAAGETFYAFLPRAWWEAFIAGYEMEAGMRSERSKEKLFDLHPYAIYIGGALATMIVVTVAFGGFGLLVLLALAGYAQLQLHLSDYVQHYGLLRQKDRDGHLEPVGPQHSWNAPHPASAFMMLNSPRHSDHHYHPARPFPTLDLPPKDVAPRLPYSLPVMGAIALVPGLWFRIMDARLGALRPDRWSRPIT